MPDKAVTKDVTIPGYGRITGDFTCNEHGWFCREINGLPWDYRAFGMQVAQPSARAAAMVLLRLWEDREGD